LGKWFLHASLGSEANELDSATFSGDGWSDEKRAQLISIWEQDISIQEIAEELGVSESRIASEVIKNDLVIFDEEFTAAINAYYGYS